jgi:hypothetical protein
VTQSRLNPKELGSRLSYSRREFLRSAAGLTLASTLLRSPFARAANIPKKKKVVVVTFGGGARDQETFAPEGQENIPNMMRELLPRATFFTQVVNRGILGHYVATASLATGVYETINNFAALPPANPTVFEYYRKDLRRPSSDAWVVAPSNGFNRIGESNHRSYGEGMGARVILPKYLLKAAMSGGAADYEHLLRDNYENPYYTPELGNREFELQQLEMILKLSASEFKAYAKTLSSPDELSLYIVRQLIRQVAPSFLWITMHDIDVAHAGAYSLYIEGIRAYRQVVRRTLEIAGERTGVFRQDNSSRASRLRPRCRRGCRREWISTSSHWRCRRSHNLAYGNRAPRS